MPERPPIFRQARAALRYDEQARRLILPLKHGDRVELASILAPMMARAGAALLQRAELLVPVPLHRHRLFQRKYNQAAVLAFAVGRLAHRPVLPDALIRTRRTAPLDDKSPEERAREVAGSIRGPSVAPARLAGRTILLVDDVMTSGSTADACAAALLEAGAVAVDVLVAARVPDPRLDSRRQAGAHQARSRTIPVRRLDRQARPARQGLAVPAEHLDRSVLHALHQHRLAIAGKCRPLGPGTDRRLRDFAQCLAFDRVETDQAVIVMERI